MYLARISGRTPHSTTSVRSFDGDASFTVPPLRGTRKHALAEPNSVMGSPLSAACTRLPVQHDTYSTDRQVYGSH